MNWIWYLIVFVAAALVIIVWCNYQVRGMLFRLMAVRGLKGGRILIDVESKLDVYQKVGYLKDKTVSYKKRGSKIWTKLIIPDGVSVFHRSYGIFVCDIDEEKNAFLLHNADAVSGFDMPTYEALYVRALMDMGDKINWKAILIILIIVGVAVVVVGVMVNNNGKAIAEVTKKVMEYCTTKVIE